jgi:methylmalonyl-CoA mutase, N-terminal domain
MQPTAPSAPSSVKINLWSASTAFAQTNWRVEEILRVDEQVQAEQIEALQRLRAERDNEQVEAIRRRIAQTAQTAGEPLMPLFIEAVEQHVTLGEICDTLRGVFGEYQPGTWI